MRSWSGAGVGGGPALILSENNRSRGRARITLIMKYLNWPLTVAALCLLATLYGGASAVAQTATPVVRYHFSLESGPTVSVSMASHYRDGSGNRLKENDKGSAGNIYVALEMVNGVSLWDRLKIGLGTGFQFNVRKSPSLNSNGLSGILPFYLSVKYVPMKGNVSPFVEQRGGGAFWSGTSIVNPVGGFYAGYVGVHLRSPKRVAGSIGLGYQMAHWASSGQAYTQTYGLIVADANHFTSFVSFRGAISF